MIEVSPIVAKKINYYQNIGPAIEWLGLLVGKTQQDNILLEDILLADQTVSDASTELDDVNIHQVIFENADMLIDSHIIGWVHTHPGMSAFLSGTDFDTINQAYHDYDPFISVVGGITNIWGVKTGAEYEYDDELEELYPFVGAYGSHGVYPPVQGWQNIRAFEWKVWLSTVSFGFRMTAELNIVINPDLMPSRRQKKALKRIFKKHVKLEVKPHVSTKITVHRTPKAQHL